MLDRELLELAAKAADVKGTFIEKCPEDGYPGYTCGIGTSRQINKLWNPLTDDGDALRLAVDLSLDIMGDCGKMYVSSLHNPWPEGIVLEPDPYAATRRAIVRAAAEIGRGI